MQAGEIGGAERGRLLDLRPVDGAADEVGEALHGPVGTAAMPPSTRSIFGASARARQSACMAARRSAVWKQTLSSAACANSRGPVARVRPNSAPRTSGRQ